MQVRLTHIDGKLPNLALMKLAHWHRDQGDQVHLSRQVQPSMFEPAYDLVYGSAIFQRSKSAVIDLLNAWPDAVVNGTGTDSLTTVEEVIEVDQYEHYDYSIYPDYPFSLGFTQRGCRLNCGFCVVPKKEGKPRSINTIQDIWRPGTPKAVNLLDNDFFGQERWTDRIAEIQEGGFKVSFSQGINIRMTTEETATAIASIRYYDSNFKHRRLYTAWDNLGQEKVFFRGLDALNAAGIPSTHVMVYMLVGYKPGETMEEILYRYHRLRGAGCRPYPMVFNKESNKELRRFQRWAVRRLGEWIAWEDYNR